MKVKSLKNYLDVLYIMDNQDVSKLFLSIKIKSRSQSQTLYVTTASPTKTLKLARCR